MPAHQVGQQFELTLGELHLGVAPERTAPVQVEPDAAVFEIAGLRGVGGRMVGQDASYPCHEPRSVERLGYEVHCSEVERVDPGGDVRDGEENDHRRPEPTLAQPHQHLEPVRAWQHQVQEHQVDPVAGKPVKSGLSVRDRLGDVTLSGKQAAQHAPHAFLVVDDHDSAHDLSTPAPLGHVPDVVPSTLPSRRPVQVHTAAHGSGKGLSSFPPPPLGPFSEVGANLTRPAPPEGRWPRPRSRVG